MIKLSNVNKYTETPVLLNKPEEKVEHEIENYFMCSILFEDVLITRHPKKIKIWDVKNLPTINMISSFEIDWTGTYITRSGNLLYVGQEDFISVFDISDVKKPVNIRKIALPNYKYFHVAENKIYALVERAIYLTDEAGVSNKIIDLPEDNEMMFDYPIDINKVKNKLYIVFRHCGLYLYQQAEENGEYEFISKHNTAQGYTPTDIQWLNEGEQMLLIGNDNVVQYNVTNSKKFKRYKAAKIKTNDIYGDLVARDNDLLIIGQNGAKDKFVIGVLEPSEKGVAFVSKPKVEYKLRVKKGTAKYGEAACGLALKGDYLLVVGKESGFFLFEAGE